MPVLGRRRVEGVAPELDVEGYTTSTASDGRPILVIGPELADPWLGLLQLRYAQEELDQLARRFVRLARDAGLDWESIGSALGVSRQTAARQFPGVDDDEELGAAVLELLEQAAQVISKGVARGPRNLP